MDDLYQFEVYASKGAGSGAGIVVDTVGALQVQEIDVPGAPARRGTGRRTAGSGSRPGRSRR